MYSLTLTKSERDAFDWVGGRYDSSGDAMARLIRTGTGPDDSWFEPGDVTFNIAEHIAWEMNDLAYAEDYQFTCFSADLHSKMMDFLGKIV
jgi:hypothetical protein